MKLTREEAERLAQEITKREEARRKRRDASQVTTPAREGHRSIRVLVPLDLWKALRHIAIDLDQSVNEIALQAVQEFVERNREPK